MSGGRGGCREDLFDRTFLGCEEGDWAFNTVWKEWVNVDILDLPEWKFLFF